MKMSPKPVFLDVDSSIVEKNLRIAEDSAENEFNSLFPPEAPCKVVKPFPGFCIKSKELGSEAKIFVNICHTDAIPAPEDISEERLVELCNSESEEECEFRIPMSIGDIHSESDKKGNDAKAVDIAINPQFFNKVDRSSLFRNFFMAVVFEGLRNKHKLCTTDDRILLKNRKVYGELQLHRIQQREVAQKMGQTSVLEELTGTSEPVKGKAKIETLSSVTFDENEVIRPKYRLFKKPSQPNTLFGEFKVPNVIDCKEMTLDVGEDRIILESKTKNYLLDIFVPESIDQDGVRSSFDKSSKILNVTMPIHSS